MLFNITFLLFTILGRASSTNVTSQNLILYNETRIVDERNLMGDILPYNKEIKKQ
jgi:hypothetical protein